MPYHKLTREQRDSVVGRYLAGESSGRIAAALGIDTGGVCGLLKRRGVRLRGATEANTRHTCDHAYFDHVRDEPRAYWLGFLYADGCILRPRRPTHAPVLQLALATTDRDHVRAFRSALQSTHAVTGSKNAGSGAVRVAIPSRQLCDDLARFGVVPRKSLVCAPPMLPSDLERHFWRGVFDGDGTLGKYGTHSPQLSLAGTEKTCRGFAAWVGEVAGQSAAVRAVRANFWTASISGYARVLRVGAALYEDATVWLPRKRAKLAQIARLAAERWSHGYLRRRLEGDVSRAVRLAA